MAILIHRCASHRGTRRASGQSESDPQGGMTGHRYDAQKAKALQKLSDLLNA